ncbi:MAG: hypothetical protein LBN12_01355 [Clostridiales Family XIII bacterium]|jgi:hypothetical protein|nr:hypothetical protein [Clostridiales Family XIII bacterium]
MAWIRLTQQTIDGGTIICKQGAPERLADYETVLEAIKESAVTAYTREEVLKLFSVED